MRNKLFTIFTAMAVAISIATFMGCGKDDNYYPVITVEEEKPNLNGWWYTEWTVDWEFVKPTNEVVANALTTLMNEEVSQIPIPPTPVIAEWGDVYETPSGDTLFNIAFEGWRTDYYFDIPPHQTPISVKGTREGRNVRLTIHLGMPPHDPPDPCSEDPCGPPCDLISQGISVEVMPPPQPYIMIEGVVEGRNVIHGTWRLICPEPIYDTLSIFGLEVEPSVIEDPGIHGNFITQVLCVKPKNPRLTGCWEITHQATTVNPCELGIPTPFWEECSPVRQCRWVFYGMCGHGMAYLGGRVVAFAETWVEFPETTRLESVDGGVGALIVYEAQLTELEPPVIDAPMNGNNHYVISMLTGDWILVPFGCPPPDDIKPGPIPMGDCIVPPCVECMSEGTADIDILPML